MLSQQTVNAIAKAGNISDIDNLIKGGFLSWDQKCTLGGASTLAEGVLTMVKDSASFKEDISTVIKCGGKLSPDFLANVLPNIFDLSKATNLKYFEELCSGVDFSETPLAFISWMSSKISQFSRSAWVDKPLPQPTNIEACRAHQKLALSVTKILIQNGGDLDIEYDEEPGWEHIKFIPDPDEDQPCEKVAGYQTPAYKQFLKWANVVGISPGAGSLKKAALVKKAKAEVLKEEPATTEMEIY